MTIRNSDVPEVSKMSKSAITDLFGSLSKAVNFIFVLKDGTVMAAKDYERTRIVGGGYPLVPGYDVFVYRVGWPCIIRKVDVSDVKNIFSRKDDCY